MLDTLEIDGQHYKLATLNRRMLGAVVDIFLLGVCVGPILDFLYTFIYGATTPLQMMNDLAQDNPKVSMSEFIEILYTHGMITKLLLSYILSFLVFGTIVLSFWHFKGATPGKMLVRCTILDATTGKAPSMRQLILRLLGYLISATPACLGFIAVLFTKKRQSFHDMLANTVVVVAAPRFRRGKHTISS